MGRKMYFPINTVSCSSDRGPLQGSTKSPREAALCPVVPGSCTRCELGQEPSGLGRSHFAQELPLYKCTKVHVFNLIFEFRWIQFFFPQHTFQTEKLWGSGKSGKTESCLTRADKRESKRPCSNKFSRLR